MVQTINRTIRRVCNLSRKSRPGPDRAESGGSVGPRAGYSAPFDALVLTLDGALTLTIGGKEVQAEPDTIVVMPANVPHAVYASQSSRMLLIMLREPTPA